MAADGSFERQMVGSGRMLDLGQLQDSFQLLLSQADPDHIAAFFYWLDLKVAQFKVFGNCLSQGNEFYSPQKKRRTGIPSELPTVNGNSYGGEDHHQFHRDMYVSRHGENGTRAEDGYSDHIDQYTVMNSTEDMPPLCSLQELDMTVGHREDSNTKQAVKSLLRAMLVKPQPTDLSSPAEVTVKSEFDSSSDGTPDRSLARDGTPEQTSAADGKDEENPSANDAAVKDESALMESETDVPPPGNTWLSSSAHPSPEKASRCPYCLKMFRYRSSFRRHVKIHEGIFSHECTVCLRKFTRKEHFVRHKCDRRPNKPYNISNEVMQRISSQKMAARQVTPKSRESASHLALGRLDGASSRVPTDAPLELTCQSTGKQLNVPKLLFTGGTVSSVPSKSLDASYSVCSPLVIDSTFTADGNISVVSMASGSGGVVGSGSGGISSGSELTRSVEACLLQTLQSHNESRRKSSTPRKVVATASAATRTNNSTIESDSFPRDLSSAPVSVME